MSKTKDFRKQLRRLGVEYSDGVRWPDGHVTNRDNVTCVGEASFWEEEGQMYAHDLPLTVAQMISVIKSSRGDGK